MCFSPQRRAIFQHLNFKKWSETLSFFNMFTWKCPSRHSGVQFFNISTSKSVPNPSVFLAFSLQNVLLATAACNFWFLLWPHDSAPAALTSLLFDSPDTRTIWKTQHFATSLTFGAWIFFLLTFALLHLLSSDFTSSHLLFICFSTLHIVGSLLFKLPSTSEIIARILIAMISNITYKMIIRNKGQRAFPHFSPRWC